jgi:glutathione synthase/RimK-type ligase-like ATP-grasp enzyme
LAFVTAGDFMVNTPIDFLLHGSDAVLILHFVDEQTADLADLPPHDVAFMAIGESPETLGVLARMGALLRDYSGRCFNAATDKVAGLCRDGVAQMLAGEASIFAPFTVRLDRADVVEALVADDMAYPVVLRPVGSHAGAGMARVLGAGDLADWLRMTDAPEVFLAPFIDYRGADGLYAKQRVVLIQGRPFASHLAASAHWMVHYLNADMTEHADRRAAEADWMAGFDADFAARHAQAFAALYRLVGLDYFGMDCAELPDGRLLIFELDVAMIVHDMDSAAVFPYKKPVMHKLFAGFLGALEAAAESPRLTV